ncbi:MAG TPA: winged helix-turn-helix domain-containing protein [Pirellulaceae bacterium]|nr:winged helix-turn-helix domain-containing protein [Pirellulaceae bacterium]HMO91814.1 winged helix-turn-helix domain-containing protein [Pirellulaceae bacterium]HMP69877.1 winged helix-turn-helix domain-containing protein [Pirellulaceae bacterium]
MSQRIAADETATKFAALGDRTRLELLVKLGREGPQSIKQLSEGFSVTRQAITKHLHVLLAAELVEERVSGREHRFGAKPQSLLDLRHSLDMISQQWDDALARLQRFVEEND